MLRHFCFLAALAIIGVRSASAPFIKPCKATDRECLQQSAQAALPIIAPGIPEMGLKSLDPMELKLVVSDKGGLKLTFRDTLVIGMKKCSVDDIKVDMDKMKQAVTIRCSVTLKGQYTLGGNLLVFPVQGEGPFTIKIRDIVIKAYSDLTTVKGEDGKPHWSVVGWKHTYFVKTSTEFDFQNLFNGNKQLGGIVTQFMNNSWRDVMKEVAGPVVKAIVDNVVAAVQALYKAVPAEELYIPA